MSAYEEEDATAAEIRRAPPVPVSRMFNVVKIPVPVNQDALVRISYWLIDISSWPILSIKYTLHLISLSDPASLACFLLVALALPNKNNTQIGVWCCLLLVGPLLSWNEKKKPGIPNAHSPRVPYHKKRKSA